MGENHDFYRFCGANNRRRFPLHDCLGNGMASSVSASLRGRSPLKFWRGRYLWLGAALITLLSAGCGVVGPDFVQPTPQLLSSDFLGQTKLDQHPVVGIDSWWQNFSDPTLNQLVGQALRKNLNVQQAAERIIEARANVRLNGGRLAPNVDSLTNYDFVKRAPNARPFSGDNIGNSFSLFQLGLDASWEIDLFGRIARSIEAAEAEWTAQNYSLQDLQQTLVADVATSYLNIRLLQNQIGTVNQSIALQQATQTLVADRKDAGLSTQLDSEQTTAFLHRSQADKVALEQQLGSEFNRLSILIGESPAQPIRDFVGDGPVPAIPALPAVGIPADLIRRRPDIRRQEAEVAVATARIGIAEADLYPTLTLLGTISVGSTDISSLFQSDSLAFSLGPSFRWNILHFGRIHANIEIHESQLRQTIAGYRQAILLAVGEVEDAIVKHDGFHRQLIAFEMARDADAQAVELSLERYRVGKANFQRVLDAQLQLLQDSQATASARANATIQLIRLYRAMGGGWPGANCCPPNPSNEASALATTSPSGAKVYEIAGTTNYPSQTNNRHVSLSVTSKREKTPTFASAPKLDGKRPQKLVVDGVDWSEAFSQQLSLGASSVAVSGTLSNRARQVEVPPSATPRSQGRVHRAATAGYFLSPADGDQRDPLVVPTAHRQSGSQSQEWSSRQQQHLED